MLTGPALSAFAIFHSSECAAVVNVPGANGAVAEERSSAKAIEEIAAKPIAAQRAVLTMRTSLLPLWGRHDFAKHGETGHPYELTEGGGRSRGAAPRSDRATRRRGDFLSTSAAPRGNPRTETKAPGGASQYLGPQRSHSMLASSLASSRSSARSFCRARLRYLAYACSSPT